MCELFGFSGRKPESLNGQLREFFSHSEDNPHGFGLMYGGKLYKEAAKANDSRSLPKFISDFFLRN